MMLSSAMTDESHPVTVLVLAAGLSRRMGEANKLLLPLGGEPMVRRVVRQAVDAGPQRVLVVLGHDAPEVEAALEGLPVTFVLNADYEEGLGASVRAGARAVADDSAVIVCLGDMPTVSAKVITRLMQAYRAHPDAPGCQASDGTRRGNPVLWAPSCLSSLRQCVGDQGARALLQQYGEQVLAVDVSEKSVTDDIDTPEDYARVLSGRDA